MSAKVGYIKLVIVSSIGFVLWQLGVPKGLSPQSWHLFIIFLTTVLGIIANPLPIGAVSLLGVLACILTQTLTVGQTLGGFGNPIIWLVVLSFMIARGFIKTGLGKRIAYFFISKFGRSTLGLSYGLVLTDLMLAPMIPSVTARGGGIVFPIAKSLAEEYELQTKPGEDKKRTGAFLMKVCFQTNVVTSAMFLTSMAGNPLAAQLANNNGVKISWGTWALGSIVPGIATLALLPMFLYFVFPPNIKITEDAPAKAKAMLKEMGRVSGKEIVMLCTFLLLIVCWILDKKIGLDATTTALMGVIILLLSSVLTWDDAIQEKGAWDTFVWFAVLVMMSDFLSKLGLMTWLGDHVDNFISHDAPILSATAMCAFYFFAHYLFASATAHITVLYSMFLIVLVKLGFPALPCALFLAYCSSLSAGLTHYGVASAPVFYGANYLTTKQWWKIGLFAGLFIISMWVIVGGAWWKILGWL